MAEANGKFKIENGYAIIIDNRTFTPGSGLPERKGVEHGRYGIEKFCREAGLTVGGGKNLTLAATRSLLKDIQKVFKANHDKVVAQRESQNEFPDREKEYDGFVAFISSHGIQGELYTTDGGTITVREIVSTVEGNPFLKGKPKIFFFNNCLDPETVFPASRAVEPLYFPMSCDVLIGYASVDGYENPRNRKKGSWGARVLRQVLLDDAFDMSLTELLTIVVREDCKFDPAGEESDFEPAGDRQQVSCYITTLTRPVHFIRRSQPPMS